MSDAFSPEISDRRTHTNANILLLLMPDRAQTERLPLWDDRLSESSNGTISTANSHSLLTPSTVECRV